MEVSPIRAKRNFIIYIGVLLLLLAVFLIWFFYFRLDDSGLHSLESKIQSNKDVKKYFSDLAFSRDDKQDVVTYDDGSSKYPYKLIGSFNKGFSKLSIDEKINAFNDVDYAFQTATGAYVKCGYKKDCTLDEIDVVNPNSGKLDMYSFDIHSEKIKHNYDDKNGVYHTKTLVETDSPSNNDSSNNNTSTDTTQQTPQEPQIGMTTDEVLNSTWGKPDQINKTTTADGVSEQWVYDDANGIPNKFVYLDDGIVTSIQESN